MVKNATGDHLDTRSITRPNAEVHGYQPTPSDLKSTKDAKLILSNGLGLECQFKKFTADSDAKTVNVPEGVKPILITEGDYEDRPNPRTRMNPKNGALYVHNIVKVSCDLDAMDYSDYKADADEYVADIERVGEGINTTLFSLNPKQRTLVSCEGVFSYLARDYNLNEEYLQGVNTGSALTPSRVAEVENYVKESKTPAVFCESTIDEKMKPIVESTGMKFSGELYVDSPSEADSDVPTYLDSLKYDAKLITSGLIGK